MEPLDQEDLESLKFHLRAAFALIAKMERPKVRGDHEENMALLGGHPKPGPLPKVGPPIVTRQEPAEEVE